MSAPLHQWARAQLTALNVPVTRLVTDSRAIQRGDTFVAYPGEKTDGRQFIANAIMQGANAVIYEKLLSGHPREAQHFVWNDAWQVPNLAVADLRHKAGWLADAVYGTPSEKLWVVGITGTNGKTSTSHWIAHALSGCRKKMCADRHVGQWLRRCVAGNREHHARCDSRAWFAGRLFAGRRAGCGDGSVFARAVPGARECGAF